MSGASCRSGEFRVRFRFLISFRVRFRFSISLGLGSGQGQNSCVGGVSSRFKQMLNSDCPNLQLLARGKVRDLYRLDNDLLLFVATDRISAYDVIMKSGIPGKGKILTQMSAFWFSLLNDVGSNHLITCDINKMPHSVQEYKEQLEGRVMMIKSCKILPVEAIVRGYITGSGMKEYAVKGTVCDIPLPAGLKEADKLNEPLFTPSTKADLGEHDQNIHPNKLPGMIGEKYAKEIEEKAIKLYTKARDYAFTKGIIIADTKFEFGIDQGGRMILVDEVLTPGMCSI
jgi:phosphoribosylaminoimidazole-succinocarboxamide synthase